MGKTSRAISIVLSAVMLASVCLPVTSCKKKPVVEEEVKKTISETDTWYNTRKTELVPNFSEDISDDMFVYGPWLINDKLVMQYSTFSGTLYAGMGFITDPMNDLVGIFDLEGNLLNMVNISDIMRERTSGYYAESIITFCEAENRIRFFFTESAMSKVYSCDIDPDTGLLPDSLREIDLGYERPGINYVNSVGMIDGYELYRFTSFDQRYYDPEYLVVAKDGKFLYEVNFEDAFGQGKVTEIYSLYGGGQGPVFVDAICNDHLVTGNLDLETGKVTKVTDMKQIYDLQSLSVAQNGKQYLCRADGIYECNPEGSGEVLKINFNSCEVNRYEAKNGKVLYFDENKVILGCNPEPTLVLSTPSPTVIYTLEKADRNPNAGKNILTVANMGRGLHAFEAKALQMFNLLNQDYYAQVVCYDQYNYLSDIESEEKIDSEDLMMYNARAMAAKDLIADIQAGEVPDVILGAAGFADILDSKYLMDLKPYLDGDSFSLAGYYMNVIDAAQTDGKTLFIPTAFTISGIVTSGTIVDAEHKGFTYEEYASFVNDEFQGVEPGTRETSRMHFMNTCIKANYAQLLTNKESSFDSKEFKDMSMLFKNTIPEGVSVTPDVWFESYDNIGRFYSPTTAVFVEDIPDLSSLAHVDYFGDDLKITGLPSPGGCGPSANVKNSFSVTAGSKSSDGAFALLDLMLSREVQNELSDAIPVNRGSVMNKIDKEKAANREAYRYYTGEPGTSTDYLYRECWIFVPGSKLPDNFLQALEDIDSVTITDNAVMSIISEEFPAYFSGEKDLDTVLSSVKSRTQAVYNER